MDDHAGRFINHDTILVLVEDIQGSASDLSSGSRAGKDRISIRSLISPARSVSQARRSALFVLPRSNAEFPRGLKPAVLADRVKCRDKNRSKPHSGGATVYESFSAPNGGHVLMTRQSNSVREKCFQRGRHRREFAR
jgi:hypothetical protein